jgi:hypothetical protein
VIRSDFAQSWDNAKQISKKEFWAMAGPHMNEEQKKFFEKKEKKYKVDYKFSEDNNVLFFFTEFEDVHYFFDYIR